MKAVASIGITGGMGSGKTFICKLFAEKGIRIYYADAVARNLLETHAEIKEKVAESLGTECFFPDGCPNRPYIANLVFNNPEKLKLLNAILHPATIAEFEIWKKNIPPNYAWSFQLKEAAILFESGTDQELDAVISVYAPKNIRIQRILKRDTIEEKEILARMSQQWAEQQKILKSDYTLFNDDQHSAESQVEYLCTVLKTRFPHGLDTEKS